MLRVYEKRPQKASYVVLDDHETQKPNTTRAQNLRFTHEWLDNPDPLREIEVNIDFPQELYTTCVNFFRSNLQRITKKTIAGDKYWLGNLNEELGRLHLWGLSFVDGRLATVLNQSDELRNDILGLLSDISQLLINNLASFLNRDQDRDEDRDRHSQIAELKFLIKRSKAIISSSNESDVEDDESVSSNETNLSQLSDSKSAIQEDGAPSGHQHTLVSPTASQVRIEGTSVASATCSDTEDDSSDESSSTFESALQCHIDCLMDLIPTLEKSLAHVESKQHIIHAARPPFSVSEAALPFVLQVRDKFPTAPTKLIERLGESNWQRFTVPRSILHDSGDGTSITSKTQRAISVASHTSFISSRAEGGHISPRVPPTPPEVALGKPFTCEMCSEVLHTIKNRIEWKLHVFADLQPYICTFKSCDDELTRFPTRKLWMKHDDIHRFDVFWRCPLCREDFDNSSKLGDHLTSSKKNKKKSSCSMTAARLSPIIQVAQHRVPHPIESQSCPLCKITLGKSRTNYITHVGGHMEDIALAALPHAIEDNSDEALADSIEDHRISMRDGKPEQAEHQYYYAQPQSYSGVIEDCFSDSPFHMDGQRHDASSPEAPLIEHGNKMLSFQFPSYKYTILDSSRRPTSLSFTAQLHGMFFLAESSQAGSGDSMVPPIELTCYRRNLFQITGCITLPQIMRHVLTDQGDSIPIIAQELSISATESVEGHFIKIISVPWKIPTAGTIITPEEKIEKEPSSIPLYKISDQYINNDYAKFPIEWKRLQFRIATANNGRRKELQQHFTIKLNVLVTLATGEKVSICEALSKPIIVRGRSPRNFQQHRNFPLNGTGDSMRKAMQSSSLKHRTSSPEDLVRRLSSKSRISPTIPSTVSARPSPHLSQSPHLGQSPQMHQPAQSFDWNPSSAIPTSVIQTPTAYPTTVSPSTTSAGKASRSGIPAATRNKAAVVLS